MNKLAALLDRDKVALENIGVPAAANVGKVLVVKAKLALEDALSKQKVIPVIHEYMSHMEPIILDGMVAGHLSARARMTKLASKALASRHFKLSAYDEALKYYQKRMALSDEDVQKLRKLYGNEAARVTRSASDLVEKKAAEAISESLKAGEHIKLAQARLLTALESAGISEPSPFLCETLVRTGISQAYSAGQYNALNDDALKDVHQGWQYVTVGDNRVRPEHEELDGMTADVDNEVWDKYLPPLGFNCRCTVIPLFSDFEEDIPDDLPEIDPEWAYDKRAAYVDHFGGKSFSFGVEDEARDEHGRWTSGNAFVAWGSRGHELKPKLRAEENLSDHDQKWVDAMDEHLKSSAKYEKEVHRGIRMSPADVKNLKVGGLISDKSFQSTSKNIKTATNYAQPRILDDQPTKPVVVTIAKGHSGVDVAHLVGDTASKTEQEVLLPRHTNLEITSIKKVGDITYVSAQEKKTHEIKSGK